MDELLTPVSTKYTTSRKDSDGLLTEISSAKHQVPAPRPQTTSISSPQEALETLRSQPDYPSLSAVLRFLTRKDQDARSFDLHTPSPKSASIVQALVVDIAPNYWNLLAEGSSSHDGDDNTLKGVSPEAKLLLQCLRSLTGINAIYARVAALNQEIGNSNDTSKRPDLPMHLTLYLDLLAALLNGNESLKALWTASTKHLPDPRLVRVQSQSLLSQIAGGKLLAVAAEAAAKLGQDQLGPLTRWLANGSEFTKWIARNIATWAPSCSTDDELQFCYGLLQRGMSLGYPETLIKLVADNLLLSEPPNPSAFRRVCFHQPHLAKKILFILLDHLSDRFLNRLTLEDAAPDATVSAAAGIIQVVLDNDKSRIDHLVSWCTAPTGAGLGVGIGIRRAVLSALAVHSGNIMDVLEKSLALFGDHLYIKHAAALQQEVHAQVLLVSAGYVHRLSAIKFNMLVRSGSYLSAISNRIAATQPRTRLLGMVIGESISALVDDHTKKLDFKMEDMETDETTWLKGLVHVSDPVGPFDTLLSTTPITVPSKRLQNRPPSKAKVQKKLKPRPQTPMTTTKPRAIIEEIDSDTDDQEDHDLVPQAKASDPEDSDDDATLVQRNKLRPPVYVRDLIAYFRDSQSYDKQKLALQTAPVLIRRKANFGTEVSAHADELAGLLVGVQDNFEMDDFADLRLQGMIALVVAQPKAMAPWFARTFFEGDYSLSQRSSVLIALGLSARELAGFDTSEYQSAAAFPSKQLPEKMQQLYLSAQEQANSRPSSSSRLKALPHNALDSISASLTSSFLAPLAAKAADANTGPDVLKLQSFTARYKSSATRKPRVRAIPNTTAALLATSFFFPLTAHFQVALRSSKPLILNPALLALYLQTVGIVIHAAGPSTLALPQLTAELWDLLLAVRIHVVGDVGAMRGWLVAMASLLEVNEGDMRSICETQGRQVVETREWVGGVFERTRGDDGGEENDVKMLAAGVLIKLGEAIEKYQALLMGDLIGFP
ncbi:hypothetical protein S40293_08574 [Stachybotrys chartarum IBT 40293]|nr:hypothetical protein S40293_08574 [Stachybotrys chartarum IBT 40293]